VHYQPSIHDSARAGLAARRLGYTRTSQRQRQIANSWRHDAPSPAREQDWTSVRGRRSRPTRSRRGVDGRLRHASVLRSQCGRPPVGPERSPGVATLCQSITRSGLARGQPRSLGRCCSVLLHRARDSAVRRLHFAVRRQVSIVPVHAGNEKRLAMSTSCGRRLKPVMDRLIHGRVHGSPDRRSLSWVPARSDQAERSRTPRCDAPARDGTDNAAVAPLSICTCS
jgi:hypothetical protein